MSGYSDWRYFSTEILLRKEFFPPFGALKCFGRYKYLSLKVPEFVALLPVLQPHLSQTFGQPIGEYGKPSPYSYSETRYS